MGAPTAHASLRFRRVHFAGVVGFIANQTRASHTGGSHPREIDAQLAGRVFYWDVVHPDGLTGHKFMGEISAQVREWEAFSLTGSKGHHVPMYKDMC